VKTCKKIWLVIIFLQCLYTVNAYVQLLCYNNIYINIIIIILKVPSTLVHIKI